MIKLLILLSLLGSTALYGETYENKAFRQIAEDVGVDEDVLRAICWHESRHKPRALNVDDGGEGNHSFGMCQILYSTAVNMGVKDKRCKGFTNTSPKTSRNYKNCKLFGPKTNIRIAARILKRHIKKYNGNLFKAISAYNLGSYKECRDGWLYYKKKRFKRCLKGGPVNLYYVIEIFKAMENKK